MSLFCVRMSHCERERASEAAESQQAPVSSPCARESAREAVILSISEFSFLTHTHISLFLCSCVSRKGSRMGSVVKTKPARTPKLLEKLGERYPMNLDVRQLDVAVVAEQYLQCENRLVC
jgi:hypothetical protein